MGKKLNSSIDLERLQIARFDDEYCWQVRTMELVERMRGEMDEVLFSSVIEACIRIGKLDILSNKLQQYVIAGPQGPMVECRYTAGGGLVKGLTAPTYGSMIKAYGHAKDLRRVWSLWSEMRQRAVKPTAITLGCERTRVRSLGRAVLCRLL